MEPYPYFGSTAYESILILEDFLEPTEEDRPRNTQDRRGLQSITTLYTPQDTIKKNNITQLKVFVKQKVIK